MSEFSRRVKAAREAKKLSQRALGRAIGISGSAINLVARYADETWDMGMPKHRQAFADFVSKALHRDNLGWL